MSIRRLVLTVYLLLAVLAAVGAAGSAGLGGRGGAWELEEAMHALAGWLMLLPVVLFSLGYWSVLALLGPPLLGAGLAASAYILFYQQLVPSPEHIAVYIALSPLAFAYSLLEGLEIALRTVEALAAGGSARGL